MRTLAWPGARLSLLLTHGKVVWQKKSTVSLLVDKKKENCLPKRYLWPHERETFKKTAATDPRNMVSGQCHESLLHSQLCFHDRCSDEVRLTC